MAPGAAVEEDGLVIPLIDFSKFLNGSDSERKQVAAEILKGFQTAGFIYLQHHGITDDTVKGAFSMSKNFFDQSNEAKMSLAWTSPEANRGYSAPGREKVSQLKDISDVEKVRNLTPDMKESFEIGREGVSMYPNRWPEESSVRDFKPEMLSFFNRCKALHLEVMRAVGVGMGLDNEFFDQYLNAGDNTLRLLHYPSVSAEVWKDHPDSVRAGAHSDYGSITLLFQDSRGGLQVKSPNGKFIDATPIEGTIVVNAGDLLARWSNDTIKSTIHRVVEPPRKEASVYPPRYSIAYFCNPNETSFIEAIPGTFATEQEKKYEGINTGKYLVQRLAATY